MSRSHSTLLLVPAIAAAFAAGCVQDAARIDDYASGPATFPGTEGPSGFYLAVSPLHEPAQRRLLGRSAADQGLLPLAIEIENATAADIPVDLAAAVLTQADGSTLGPVPPAEVLARLRWSHARAWIAAPFLLVPAFIVWSRVSDANAILAERIAELSPRRRVAPRRAGATGGRPTRFIVFFPRSGLEPVHLMLPATIDGERQSVTRAVRTEG